MNISEETGQPYSKAMDGKNRNEKKTTNKKCLMVLGASFDQVPMIKTAKLMGLRVLSVDSDKNAPGFFMSDESYHIDVMDEEKVLEIAKKEKIDGITTMVSNLGMRTVAFVADKMGLKAIPPQAAQIATDKTEIKKNLINGNVAVPKGVSVASMDQALSIKDQIDFPIIVKPVDGTKGRGISTAPCLDDFENCITQAMKFSFEKKVIIEEWIDGPTVGAECLIVDGELKPIILTDKYNTPPPKCVTIGLTAPSRLPEEIKERVRETAKQVAKALGLNTGAAHIDMMVSRDGIPKVIDVGPRLASGPVIFDFVPHLLGVDMVKSVIKMALGQNPEPFKKWNGKFAASRFLTVPTKGCMYSIEIPKWDQDFIFYQFKELGEIVRPPNSDTDRIGCITIKGESYDNTVKKADELLEKIKVDVVY